MDTANKTMKISPEDLDFLATQTDVPKEDLQEIYEEFCEEFSDGKITKEGYRKFMGVTKCFYSLKKEIKEHQLQYVNFLSFSNRFHINSSDFSNINECWFNKSMNFFV